MNKLKVSIATLLLTSLPIVVSAQNVSLNRIDDVNGLTAKLIGIGNTVVYLLVALGVIFIVYKVVIYFIKGKEGDEKRHEAGMQILWGIVGLAIILSLWGLVNIIVGTFSTSTTAPKDRLPSADFINQNYKVNTQNNQLLDAPGGYGQCYGNTC